MAGEIESVYVPERGSYSPDEVKKEWYREGQPTVYEDYGPGNEKNWGYGTPTKEAELDWAIQRGFRDPKKYGSIFNNPLTPINADQRLAARDQYMQALQSRGNSTIAPQSFAAGEQMLQAMAARRNPQGMAAMGAQATGLAGNTAAGAAQEAARKDQAQLGAAQGLLSDDMGYNLGMGSIQDKWGLAGEARRQDYKDLMYQNMLAKEQATSQSKDALRRATEYAAMIEEKKKQGESAFWAEVAKMGLGMVPILGKMGGGSGSGSGGSGYDSGGSSGSSAGGSAAGDL